jgi:molybdopterin-guanine dinucleotide biosynthesis protein A
MRLEMPAALLVGGSSRRMGRPKAELPWRGTTLAGWQAERLSRLFGEVWVVAKAGQPLPETAGRRLDESAAEPAAISASSARSKRRPGRFLFSASTCLCCPMP